MRLGMMPDEFWKLTPAELLAIAEGYAENRQDRIHELIYLAWHTEAFARTKQLPSLKSLIQKNEHHKEQTDDEMLAMARILNAAFGGEVKEI